MEIKKAIVTGGAGFIGSHVADKLVEMGVDVMVIDNMRSGVESNYIHHINDHKKNYQILFRDIQSLGMYDYFKDFRPDTIFHLAAIPGVAYSVDHVRESDETNVNGTANLLELSRKFEVKRFIFSSSSSVYGGSEILPTPEGIALNPKSPYALQKMIGENYCKLFSAQYGLETVCLRYFNIFGPRQYGWSPYAAVIAAFADSIKNGTPPKIHGDGEQFRDFTYVDNVVNANILAATVSRSMLGEIFNIGCGGHTTINELHKIMGCAPAEFTDSRPGDVKCSQADITRARKILGYDVEVSFEQGIEKTLNWYLSV